MGSKVVMGKDGALVSTGGSVYCAKVGYRVNTGCGVGESVVGNKVGFPVSSLVGLTVGRENVGLRDGDLVIMLCTGPIVVA